MGSLVESFLASVRIPNGPREPVRLPPGFTGFDYASLTHVSNGKHPIMLHTLVLRVFDGFF